MYNNTIFLFSMISAGILITMLSFVVLPLPAYLQSYNKTDQNLGQTNDTSSKDMDNDSEESSDIFDEITKYSSENQKIVEIISQASQNCNDDIENLAQECRDVQEGLNKHLKNFTREQKENLDFILYGFN